MDQSITTKIDVNFFLFLFKHKHLAPRTISKSIISIYKNLKDINLKFIFYIFFNDVCLMIECPGEFENIKNNTKIVDRIRNKIFEEEQPTKYDINLIIKSLKLTYKVNVNADTQLNTTLSPCNALHITNLLLILEKNIADLFFYDTDYFVFVNSNLRYSDKINLLKNSGSLSPFNLNILLSLKINDVPNQHIEIYHFLNSIGTCQIENMKKLESKNINHVKLGSDLLYLENQHLKVLYNCFLAIYPEIKYTSVKNSNRIKFFKNPLKIDLDVKTLKIYIPVVLENLKNDFPHLKNSLIDVLFRLIYIERLLKNKPTKIEYKLIHSLILDSSQVVVALVGRRFNEYLIEGMVKYVPSMFIAFNIALKMYLKSKCVFYLKLMSALLKKYPTRNNFKKIKEHMNYLPPTFIMEFNNKLNLL